jgi:hypothetical protein
MCATGRFPWVCEPRSPPAGACVVLATGAGAGAADEAASLTAPGATAVFDGTAVAVDEPAGVAGTAVALGVRAALGAAGALCVVVVPGAAVVVPGAGVVVVTGVVMLGAG